MPNLLSSAKENLTFLLVCLLVFAALLFLAIGAERLLKTKRSISSARYISVTALCSALARCVNADGDPALLRTLLL